VDRASQMCRANPLEVVETPERYSADCESALPYRFIG
jgi:hypothetical protein